MPGDVMDNTIGVTATDPGMIAHPDEKHQGPSSSHATTVPPVMGGQAMGTVALTEEELHDDSNLIDPTEEEFHTLRRVPNKIPWLVYTIAFVELCERFSYYGTTIVFTNFIQQPLPLGSRTGAGGGAPEAHSGALGKGQQTATGITTFNQFWAYTMPLFGAYIADTYLGRFRTICVALGIALIGHLVLIISAIPPVITKPDSALACMILGIIIMGGGTGGFKPNISPLIVEQLPVLKPHVITLKTGERVINDPTLTASRIYHYFYMFVNIGALVGQIGMTYAEKYVGFWLAYLLPTLVYLCCPAVLLFCRNRYVRYPPEGSVLGKAFRIFAYAQKGRWSFNPYRTWKNMHDGTFWESAKPSNIEASRRPAWMTYDDAWVDEVRRGFNACAVFCWYPLWWVTYNQLNNNLVSQAAVMKLNGLPNDVLSNLDPFALIIFIPICDLFIYPALRRYKINFSPIKKITAGFFTGALSMLAAALIQNYIYKQSECGYDAGNPDCAPVQINVWVQTPAYVLIALSEIFASITSLEYAFSKAPRNMRSMVQAVALFTSAISSAIGEALNPLSADPLLVWNYGVMGVLSTVGGILFWIQFRGLDAEEDALNMLPVGHVSVPEKYDEQMRVEEEKRAEERRLEENRAAEIHMG